MKLFKEITDSLAEEKITVEDALLAICDGIKKKYNLENLYFSKDYCTDGYGEIFSMNYLHQWKCSTQKNQRCSIDNDPCTLEKLFLNLKEKREKIIFEDLNKTYNSLDDLRQDNLILRFSGV